jgi:PAS domain S-box-containing protein
VTPVIGLMQGRATTVTDADDAFLHIIGRTRDELERGEIDWVEITPPEWAHVDDAGRHQAADTGGFTTPYDKEFVRPDGRRVRVTLTCSWLADSDERWMGYVIDIAALEPQAAPPADLDLRAPQPPEFYWRLAVELARERAHQRAMLDNVDALIWTIDDEFRLLSANKAFFDVMVDSTGVPAKIGMSLLADVPYPDPLTRQRDQWGEWDRRALAGERVATLSVTELQNRTLEYENVLSPMLRDDGRVVGVACLSLDVTARVVAERALRDSEARFRTLASAAPVGIFLLDLHGAPVYMNERCEEIVGRSLAELSVGSRRDHVHEDDRDAYVSQFRHAIDHREPWDATFRFRQRNGEVRHVRSVLMPIRDGDDVNGFVGSLDDQTERVVMGARLAQRERLESLGTLAGGIAHDFNNVLAVVLGHAELALLEAPDEPALRSSIEQIRTASLRARDMVRQILAFSRRSEHGHGAIDLAALVEESVGLMLASWPPDVQCNLLRPDEPIVVVGDLSALQRVVVNLCSNARDAVRDEPAPRVWVSAEVDGGQAVLKVTDNGRGIPSTAVDHIFEPFFSTKAPGDGTGMGLAVAHGVVTAHGGSITVDTAPGRGTTFTVALPLAPQGTEPIDRIDAVGPAPVPDAEATTSDGWEGAGPPTVLVVEDEPAVADVVRVALERAGCHVVVSTSGEAAFERFLEAPDAFDVVLSDVVMPGLSGDRLVSMMLRERPDLPVMLMTGYSSTVTPEYAERLGVRTLLHKPLGIHEVVEAVRAVVAPGRV